MSVLAPAPVRLSCPTFQPTLDRQIVSCFRGFRIFLSNLSNVSAPSKTFHSSILFSEDLRNSTKRLDRLDREPKTRGFVKN